MIPTTNRRLINPRLGIYFGIFSSAFASLVMLLVIFEQLGVADGTLRWLMMLVPLVLYAAIGIAARTTEPAEFFASGRRVPAVYTGLVLSGSAIGGAGLVIMTGLFFINGFDAWCIAIGFTSGFVVMALVIAPYLRKFGAYTVPSYLGRRFESRSVRLAAAAAFAAPMLLVLMAELKMAAFAAMWLTGSPEPITMAILVLFLVVAIVMGGMRSLSWSNTAQAIVSLIALVVPVSIVAALVTNLPLPQLSHGPVLRGIGRLEAIQGVPVSIAPALALELAGGHLEALAHRIASPYGHVGPIAFIFTTLTVMCGIAGAPWLLPRCGATPGVFETRKAIGWATVIGGIVLLTTASVAVFMRDIVMDTLVGQGPDRLPAWFERLRQIGVAGVQGSATQLPLGSFGFLRDGVLTALPIASGFPEAIVHLTLAGIVAAALLAASATACALGNMLAEDGFGGLVWQPPAVSLRLNVARSMIALSAVAGGWIALAIPADPLDLLLWAFTLSASTAFPVLALSVWWKRLNALGALTGIVAGFVVAALAMIAGDAGWLGVPGRLAAVFGLPAGFAAAVLASKLTPFPARHVYEMLRDMRLPGGETVHDREIRHARLKQQP